MTTLAISCTKAHSCGQIYKECLIPFYCVLNWLFICCKGDSEIFFLLKYGSSFSPLRQPTQVLPLYFNWFIYLTSLEACSNSTQVMCVHMLCLCVEKKRMEETERESENEKECRINKSAFVETLFIGICDNRTLAVIDSRSARDRICRLLLPIMTELTESTCLLVSEWVCVCACESTFIGFNQWKYFGLKEAL